MPHKSPHPDLAKKLKLLHRLRVNPQITSNVDLAEKLGISRQAVSKWCTGTETRHGDCIPAMHLSVVAELYGIGSGLFSLELTEFESRLSNRIAEASGSGLHKPEKITNVYLPITDRNVYGRNDEIEGIFEAWNNEQCNVLQVIAFGGVGKTALVNHWLSEMSQCGYLGAKYVYAWSFYWQGSSDEIKSSGEFFMEHALEWFGDSDPSRGTPWAKATRLAELIRQQKTLLILDGLEPLQYPPGEKQGQIENPAVGQLLRDLALDNNGLCIITSRLSVAEFEPIGPPRALTLGLKNLSLQSSLALLKSRTLIGSSPSNVWSRMVISIPLIWSRVLAVSRPVRVRFLNLSR